MKTQWHLSIPKIAHFYWGGSHLNYLRYLSVKTFIKHNPDWQVIVWCPEHPFKGNSWGITSGHERINERKVTDYTRELFRLPVTKSPVDFRSLKFRDDMAEVHKADYIRMSVLHLYGGLWSDLDVLYFRPVTALKCNDPKYRSRDTFVCVSDYGHSTGFNMATESSEMFAKLVSVLKFEFKKGAYQCWGPDLFNKYFKDVHSIPGSYNMEMDTVYAHNCHQVAELLEDGKPRFTEYSIGCHWYAGNTIWGSFMNKTDGGRKNLPPSIISRLITNAVPEPGRTGQVRL